MNFTDLQNKSIGLVLSGGGVRGMAHIGALKALKEHQIEAKVIAGSSAGALIGALYAGNRDIEDMLAFFKETPLFKYNFLTINKPGLVDTERYYDIFKTYIPFESFESLNKKLYVVTTNLLKGQEEIFSQGELIMPLLASAALPPVFSPVEMKNSLYADGGIMNNFPTEPLQGQAEIVIGSNVSVIREVNKKEITSSFQLASRTTSLMVYAINRQKIRNCDLVFEPSEVEQIGVLDKKGIEKAYQIGYDHASRVLEDLLQRA
ncbi:patatin-like phospholipase family protein [Muriicola soli]|uniref:Phospholipase n=1 Tax=Muriicola soli TaxID=2507538 RepID=A0A411ECF6_9FLAO|nr:patatin-like phospholipase family protein [Muriicola soli]QBA65421.1 phospholipase [Muriicola soli]